MNRKNLWRKPLALTLTAALALSSMPFALADDIDKDQESTHTYTYEAPTSPVTVDKNIITASAHRAASPILGILGVNATSGFGMINGSAPSDLASAESCAALGVWGSSLNANPDPYYVNYFYNFYAQENGLETVADALINTAAAASPVAADSTLVEEYGNISVSLYTRPDILVGCSGLNTGADVSGYDDQLATIRSFYTVNDDGTVTPTSDFYQEGDEDYAPKLVSYQTTTIKDMIWSVNQLASAIKEVMNETGKTTRYEDPLEIAAAYEKYIYGTIAYVQKELAAKGMEEKTVAVVTAINDDHTFTIGDSTSTSATSLLRAFEYSQAVSKNLADTYGTVVTLDQLLSADVIITINNQSINRVALEDAFQGRAYDGILITNTPATLYGLTMNSVENAMGFAYVIGCMYSDVLDIDPVEFCAYFYQRFLHIDDLDALDTVVKTNFADTILPAGVSVTLSSSYSASAVEAKLDAGMAYYAANPAQFIGSRFASLGMGVLYTDVSENDQYYEAIKYVTDAGLFQGDDTGAFAPTVTMNRAMIAVMLHNMEGNPAAAGAAPFTDLTADWYKDAVAWCYENKIVEGSSDTTFTPDQTADVQTIVTILYRYAQNAGRDVSESAELSAYADAGSVGEWAQPAMKWAVAVNLLDGVASGSNLNAGASAQRAITAQIMMNYGQWTAAADQPQGGQEGQGGPGGPGARG